MTGLQANLKGVSTERLQATAEHIANRLKLTTDETLFAAFDTVHRAIVAEINQRRLAETQKLTLPLAA